MGLGRHFTIGLMVILVQLATQNGFADSRSTRVSEIDLEVQKINRSLKESTLSVQQKREILQERTDLLRERNQLVNYVAPSTTTPASARQVRPQALLSDSTDVTSTNSPGTSRDSRNLATQGQAKKPSEYVAPAKSDSVIAPGKVTLSEDSAVQSPNIPGHVDTEMQQKLRQGVSRQITRDREDDNSSLTMIPGHADTEMQKKVRESASRQVAREQGVTDPETGHDARNSGPEKLEEARKKAKENEEMLAEKKYQESFPREGADDRTTDDLTAQAKERAARDAWDPKPKPSPADTPMPGSDVQSKPTSAQTPPQKSMREMENDSMKKLADYENPRCFYSGYSIEGKEGQANDCKPVRGTSDVGKDDSAENVTKTNCGASMVMCNPLVYGVDANKRGHCVKSGKEASKSCRDQAKLSKDGAKGKAAKDSFKKLMSEANKKKFEALKKKIEMACDSKKVNQDKELSANIQARKNHQDHKETCDTLLASIKDAEAAMGKKVVDRLPSKADGTLPPLPVQKESGPGTE